MGCTIYRYIFNYDVSILTSDCNYNYDAMLTTTATYTSTIAIAMITTTATPIASCYYDSDY